MKVAVVHPAFRSVGGAEIVAVNQARCLKDHGCSVRILTSFVDASRWSDRLSDFHVQQLSQAASWQRIFGELLLNRETRLARMTRALEPALRDIDLAIAHNYPMSRALLDTQGEHRKIWYCHEPERLLHLETANPTITARLRSGFTPSTYAEQLHLRRLGRHSRSLRFGKGLQKAASRDIESVRRCERVCVNSRFTQQLAESTYGSLPYSVVYPLMRMPGAAPKRSGLNRKQLGVLVHSRLEAFKNVDSTLRGFALFLRAGGELKRELASQSSVGAQSVMLHVVGEGSLRRDLERLSRQLGIADRVQFYGHLPALELERVYHDCDVFALAPIDEPFGMVFCEAMLRGLIVLGPDHGGPYEIMAEGRLGFACDPFSPHSWADALTRILATSDAEIDELRAQAEQSCRERFGWQKVEAQLLSACGLS